MSVLRYAVVGVVCFFLGLAFERLEVTSTVSEKIWPGAAPKETLSAVTAAPLEMASPRKTPRESTSTVAPTTSAPTTSASRDGLKIVIATVCVNVAHDFWGAQYGPYMNVTMANHRDYAAAHGYEYRVRTRGSEHMLNARHEKGQFLLDVMDEQHWDHVFWTDCDALFMDFSIPLTHFVRSGKDLIIAGDHACAMNAGQFLMRDVAWIREMLKFSTVCEGKDMCGIDCKEGRDQVLFNYFVWGSCKASWGPYGATPICNSIVQKSKYPKRIYCDAQLMSYAGSYSTLSSQGTLFRLHFAGAQAPKNAAIHKYAKFVKTST